ncbi:outer membrane lipoprotein Omp10 [Allorhizobium taibaishanense]|uniref:Uncharacterized lipoprotein YddW (UPF0748 family) n=1 Tax=Allorhizobium taibaishanense TaxID=887144 RepID=A0A1Q9A5U2_9HYPH|nr:outer membrane lipoprotein Omp10 [Allorhizobium taibaishanense]MBB4006705.1 uncharacterized lipoprotein YddW (UPF0748 family) [Allorhizobium taibaishanense]OLP49908.1 hypothetical protein BJF91_21590 [Allorhizobium taibaishanense]
MKVKSLATLLIASFAVSSCMSTQQPRQVAYNAPPPAGVDGAWVDPNGIVSTFQGGTFATRSSDTNALLASGTYTNTSPSLVEINMTSLVRKTQSRVNCALVAADQLNCTTDSGSNFSLRRKI